MSAKKVIQIILSTVVLASTSQVVLADDYPKLYTGKAEVVMPNAERTYYSSEVLDSSGRETSRVKVFVRDDASPPFPPNYDITRSGDCGAYDCLIRLTSRFYRYYEINNGRHPNMKLYSGKVTVGGRDVETESVLVYPPKSIEGDVYSKNDTSDFNDSYTFMGGKHLYAGAHPSITAEWQAEGYEIDTNSLLYWDTANFPANVAMKQNISRLISTSHRITTDGSTQYWRFNGSPGPFDLSPGNTLDNPEGDVWYYDDDDLTIDNEIEFSGKGTIIFTGNVTLTANAILDASDASLGIIVLGNLTISSGPIVNLKAAIFCPGTVTINAPINFSGSIVADEINIPDTVRTAIIKYDKQLATSPPPGISYFMSPTVGTTY